MVGKREGKGMKGIVENPLRKDYLWFLSCLLLSLPQFPYLQVKKNMFSSQRYCVDHMQLFMSAS